MLKVKKKKSKSKKVVAVAVTAKRERATPVEAAYKKGFKEAMKLVRKALTGIK